MIGTLFQLITGSVLLVAGKKLYWFFVGTLGAIAGLFVSESFFHPQSWGDRVLVAVGIGAAFAILALILQRIMIGVAGFIAGGYLGISLIDALTLPVTDYRWVVFILGGLIGILVVKMLFDLSLVIISSAAGAILITRAISLDGAKSLIILLVLIIAGVIVQSVRGKPKATPPAPAQPPSSK
jgi:hypothetical protein